MFRFVTAMLIACSVPSFAQETEATIPDSDQIQTDDLVYRDDNAPLIQELQGVLQDDAYLQDVQMRRRRTCWVRSRQGRIFSGSGSSIPSARQAAMVRCSLHSSRCTVRNCR